MRKTKNFLFLLMAALLLNSCGGLRGSWQEEEEEETWEEEGVELTVVTTFAGEDNNALNFRKAVDIWERRTGNTIWDESQTADEIFKAKVLVDFEAGAEPDILYFFTGSDANNFIRAGKVVPLEEIRALYPAYGNNMEEEKIPLSSVDHQAYVLPVGGYWEALFVNEAVLEAVGIPVPGSDYTWEAFLEDCGRIREAGYVPIAAALGDLPHYWWEFAIYNHRNPETGEQIPRKADSEEGNAWVSGIEDLAQLYRRGYFAADTEAETDDEAFALFMNGKAAFMLDGSWKVEGIASACQRDVYDPSTLDTEKLDQFTVTFVPSRGKQRKTTDLIGGISCGYYISRKAWEDEAKREAAVDFVSYMTSNQMVEKFSGYTATALKEPSGERPEFHSLQNKAANMLRECTGFAAALQDEFQGACRVPTFDGLPLILEDKVKVEDAVQQGFDIYYAQTSQPMYSE